jgi:hypothetical protein
MITKKVINLIMDNTGPENVFKHIHNYSILVCGVFNLHFVDYRLDKEKVFDELVYNYVCQIDLLFHAQPIASLQLTALDIQEENDFGKEFVKEDNWKIISTNVSPAILMELLK